MTVVTTSVGFITPRELAIEPYKLLEIYLQPTPAQT
jgi:hypothetical protein